MADVAAFLKPVEIFNDTGVTEFKHSRAIGFLGNGVS